MTDIRTPGALELLFVMMGATDEQAERMRQSVGGMLLSDLLERCSDLWEYGFAADVGEAYHELRAFMEGTR